MEITLNINDGIKFKLTKHGNEILQSYLDDQTRCYGLNAKEQYKVREDGYIHTEMWLFMMIFGSVFGVNEDNILIDNEIIVK
jgi:hypothetical protein